MLDIPIQTSVSAKYPGSLHNGIYTVQSVETSFWTTSLDYTRVLSILRAMYLSVGMGKSENESNTRGISTKYLLTKPFSIQTMFEQAEQTEVFAPNFWDQQLTTAGRAMMLNESGSAYWEAVELQRHPRQRSKHEPWFTAAFTDGFLRTVHDIVEHCIGEDRKGNQWTSLR